MPSPLPPTVVLVAPPPPVVGAVVDADVDAALAAELDAEAAGLDDDSVADAAGDDDDDDDELSAAVVLCEVPPRSPGCTMASATPMMMSRSAATPTAPASREFRGLSSSWVLERATGIEPASSDWKPEALPLSYARSCGGG